MNKNFVLCIFFTFVSILGSPHWSYAGPLSDIMDNNLEHLCQIARLLLKDGPYQASGKAMDDYDKIPSRELCTKIEGDMHFLCFHNDRDFADCCCRLNQILYIESKNVNLTSKAKLETLKALRCILVYLHESQNAIAYLLRSYMDEEDYNFLKKFDALLYVQAINLLLEQNKTNVKHSAACLLL
ncbi:MAG: hypothetical protein LBE99_00090 [Puniceicoccales bacterium]|jgi:hypothetical protein|nr:hypothetical protein [Puniceicoccales bacterium]